MLGRKHEVPDELLYLPATQLVHGPPLGPLKPLLHVQSLAELLPEGELDPEGQLEQVLDVVAPDVVEYLPLVQALQAKDPADMQNTSCFRPASTYIITIYMRHRESTYDHPVLQGWCIVRLDHRRAGHCWRSRQEIGEQITG